MTDNSLRHVAIIMDGNNRWAKQRGMAGVSGHKVGVERIRDVIGKGGATIRQARPPQEARTL